MEPKYFALLINLIIIFWSIFWKVLSIWRAVKSEQRNWFLVLLVEFLIGTFGIVDIVYLFFFAKKKLTLKELKNIIVSGFRTTSK